MGGTSLLCPHMVEGAHQLSGTSFIRTVLPFIKTPFSWPNHVTKSSPPNPMTMVVSFQHEFWRRHKHSDHSKETLSSPPCCYTLWLNTADGLSLNSYYLHSPFVSPCIALLQVLLEALRGDRDRGDLRDRGQHLTHPVWAERCISVGEVAVPRAAKQPPNMAFKLWYCLF
jgi:hypothetical protein